MWGAIRKASSGKARKFTRTNKNMFCFSQVGSFRPGLPSRRVPAPLFLFCSSERPGFPTVGFPSAPLLEVPHSGSSSPKLAGYSTGSYATSQQTSSMHACCNPAPMTRAHARWWQCACHDGFASQIAVAVKNLKNVAFGGEVASATAACRCCHAAIVSPTCACKIHAEV